jgi:flagellar biosynthesis protein FlhG
MPGNVVAVSSGKGGVGKTSLTVNLAVALAGNGKKVLVCDADLGLANVDITLGLKPQYDLQHVLSGERTLDEIVIEGPQGVGVIPAGVWNSENARTILLRSAWRWGWHLRHSVSDMIWCCSIRPRELDKM